MSDKTTFVGPRPTRTEALTRLAAICDGIDRVEDGVSDGWWETAMGAEFGSGKLAELHDLVLELLR